MFIKLVKNKNVKYTKVYLVEGYRDKDKKVKHRTIKYYGYLEELQREDANILEKLRSEAKSIQRNTVNLALNMNLSNDESTSILNYGYFFLDGIYDNLKIPKFLSIQNKKYNFKYDLNEILRLLTFSRILNPASKLDTVEKQDTFFEGFNVKLDDVYRSLNVLNEIKVPLQLHLHKEISAQYGRDCALVFYDVTNYYFEIDEEDDDVEVVDELTGENTLQKGLRKPGVSKEKRTSPIIQMGLFIDRNGIPIAYKLFPGNTHDCNTLVPSLKEFKEKYNLERIIVTADKGLNSGSNLGYIKNNGDGYVVSQKVRGSSKEFIGKILNEEGYVYNNARTFKVKSFMRERDIKDEAGNVTNLKEKIICFWSKDYDDREKHKREKLKEAIDTYRKNPVKYRASNKYGIKKYLKEKHINKETGEIEKVNSHIEFDEVKYNRDVALDGYYCIITSETELTNDEIIEKYRGLWKIEESFRVIKSNLEGRPVYVWNQERIEGHFLICYLALVISRILEHKLGHKYSVRKLQESLSKANFKLLENNIFTINKQDEIFKEIEEKYDVKLDCKYGTLEEIRRYKKSIKK